MILKEQRLTIAEVDRIERKSGFYATQEGETELFNLMLDCKLFQPIGVEDVPLRNYAIQKLTELGLNQEDKIRKAIHEMLMNPVLDLKAKIGEKVDGND